MSGRFPIIWLTGNSGAGKTTLATAARKQFNEAAYRGPLQHRVIVLDGDEMRASISIEETLSADDRRKHNLRVARLAKVLQSQGFLVVIAVIAPFRSVRAEIDRTCAPVWVYVERSGLSSPDRPYEPPEHPAWVICNDVLTRNQATLSFVHFVEAKCGVLPVAV